MMLLTNQRKKQEPGNMKKRRPYNKSVYRSFALIMQFGINMVVPIGMMTALGVWIDKTAGTSFWVIILFFIGALAGGQNIYRMARQIYTTPSEKNMTARNTRKKEPAETDENNAIPEKKK